MFEKEADEYADNQIGCGDGYYEWTDVTQAYQKGAEFGYNKAFIEADKNLKAVVADFNKANEWHYPSKGELPKCDDKTQLIFYVNCYYEIGSKTITRKRTVLGYYQNSFLNDDIKLFVEKSKGYEDEHLPKDIIAWKEIVLPKEIKENDNLMG